jgi:hypothetical protein
VRHIEWIEQIEQGVSMEVPAKWALIGVGVVVLAGAVWVSGKVFQPGSDGVKLADSEANISLMGAGKGAEGSADSNQANATGASNPAHPVRPVDEVRDLLYSSPSFKGSPIDGACLVDAAGKLKPDIELRRRFDYFLRDQSEVTIPEIRSLVAVDACPGKSPEVVAQMLDMWDKYWRLKMATYQHAANPNNPLTWLSAFSEHKDVRRQVLGPVWAEAFYGEEEALFQKAAGSVLGSMTGKAEH